MDARGALTRARVRAPLLSGPPYRKGTRLLLDLLELCLDDVFLVLALRVAAARRAVPRRGTGAGASAGLRRLGVDHLGELVRGPLEVLGGAAELARVLRLERFLGVGERALDRTL